MITKQDWLEFKRDLPKVWITIKESKLIALIQIIAKQYGIPLILTVCYIFFSIVKIEIIPDYLQLRNIKPQDYFGVIISATASILGILIAVILLTFQLLNVRTLKFDNKNILKTKRVSNFLYIASLIIILSLLSYVRISTFQQSNDLTIGYFLGMIFIFFVLFLFPFTHFILNETNTTKKTLISINNLTVSDFQEFVLNNKDFFEISTTNGAIHEIKQELSIAVRESNYISYNSILESLTNKVLDSMNDLNDRESMHYYFNGLSLIWKGNLFDALRVGNFQYYDSIWNCIGRIYKFAAKKRILLTNLFDIEYFSYDFIRFLSAYKQVNALMVGVSVFNESFRLNLQKNCPPQEKINTLYWYFDDNREIPHFIDESIQWNHVMQLQWKISNIQLIAVELKSKDLFEKCRTCSESLIREVAISRLYNLGQYQEGFILIRLFKSLTDLANDALDGAMFKDTAWVFRIDSDTIAELVENNNMYISRIFQTLSDYIINNQKKCRLDGEETINMWTAIGRHLSKNYCVYEQSHKAMRYIIATLHFLKQYIEDNQLPNEGKNYLEIKKQINSLKIWLEKDNTGKIIEEMPEIEKLLLEFKEINFDNDFSIIRWEDNKD